MAKMVIYIYIYIYIYREMNLIESFILFVISCWGVKCLVHFKTHLYIIWHKFLINNIIIIKHKSYFNNGIIFFSRFSFFKITRCIQNNLSILFDFKHPKYINVYFYIQLVGNSLFYARYLWLCFSCMLISLRYSFTKI